MSATIEAPQRARAQFYNDYSPEFKAEALARVSANNGNVLRTANELNIPEQSLRSWIEYQDRFRELRDQKQLDLASKSESNAHLLADSIASHDLESASLSQKATAYGIMIDKMQLLRGLPTGITESVERQELTVVLESALNAAIDVTPEKDLAGQEG